jgi:DNA modification methylase
MNKLYFGDNLDVLRTNIATGSVDLIYLDPPFNSNANYNVLFGAKGRASEAQVEAFKDTWSWEDAARDAYDDILARGDKTALLVKGLRPWLGESTMMAYIVMMAVRLVELERILKSTGSLYLHCDPTASHYLKLLLDSVFGHDCYRSEIIWKRTFAHGNVTTTYGNVTDTILFYTKSHKWVWNQQYRLLSEEEKAAKYPKTDEDGRRWQSVTLRNPGVRPNLHYPYRASNGVTYMPHPNGWSCNIERMRSYDAENKLHFPTTATGALRLKMYEDESRGERLQTLWDDIPPLGAQAQERLGYPTQKPVALLERIIRSSSPEDGVVLDPFCGCGTTIEAARNAGRQWIGIDVTHYAVTLIEKRLAKAGVKTTEYVVSGRPKDFAGARDLAIRDKHQFQWWAAWRLGAQTYREEKKGADRGIDGNIFFPNGPYGTGRIIISVKGGENVSVGMVRDLRGVIEREDAEMGVLISLAEPTSAMVSEAAAAGNVRKSAHGRIPRIQIATIADILEGKLPVLPIRPESARYSGVSKKKRNKDQLEFLLSLEGLNIKPAKGEFVDPRFMKLG